MPIILDIINQQCISLIEVSWQLSRIEILILIDACHLNITPSTQWPLWQKPPSQAWKQHSQLLWNWSKEFWHLLYSSTWCSICVAVRTHTRCLLPQEWTCSSALHHPGCTLSSPQKLTLQVSFHFQLKLMLSQIFLHAPPTTSVRHSSQHIL